MSAVKLGAASCSGRLAGSTATARMSTVSRSIARWRFVAVEALRLGLAAVPHVLVLDRDASVFGDTMADAKAAASIGVGFEILADDLPQRCDVRVERRVC